MASLANASSSRQGSIARALGGAAIYAGAAGVLAAATGCGSASTAPGRGDADTPGDEGGAGPGDAMTGAGSDAAVDAAPGVAADGSSDAAGSPFTSCPEENTPDGGAIDVWRNALGNHTIADRGLILACVHAGSESLAQVAANTYFGTSVAPTNGYELFIVQYVSEGAPGAATPVTALFYLPSGNPQKVPIAAVDHPTSGMGPSCGPTHDTAITDNVAVPLVGRGYAIVATDYAGMGVDTTELSYLNGASEAAATLDGLRALLQFHDPRFDASQLSSNFFVVGHSQGGHAALFTHQYFDSSLGVTLLGSVSFAPGLGNAKDWSDSFNSASQAIGLFDAFTTMSLYSYMNYYAAPSPSAWLLPAAQQSLPGIFHDECATVGTSLETEFPTQGALFTSTFLSASAACDFAAPCSGFQPWSTELEAQEPGGFASRAPALILQGSADTTVLPAQTQCIVDRLTSEGTPVEACEYDGLDHLSIVGGALPDAIRWMQGRLTGLDPGVCPASLAATCTLGM